MNKSAEKNKPVIEEEPETNDWLPVWDNPDFAKDDKDVNDGDSQNHGFRQTHEINDKKGLDIESASTVSGVGLTAEDGTPVIMVNQVVSTRSTKSFSNRLRRLRRNAADFIWWLIGIVIVSAVLSWLLNGGVDVIRDIINHIF